MEFLDDSSDGETIEAPVKPGTVRIIIADSQAIYRVGIRKVFALEDDLRVVAQADTVENLRFAVERYPTDVVLLEGSMLAGTANVIPELLRIAPEMKLIVQAVQADENHTVELYRRALDICPLDAPLLRARITARLGTALQALPGGGDEALCEARRCYEAAQPALRQQGTAAEAAELEMNFGLVQQALAPAGARADFPPRLTPRPGSGWRAREWGEPRARRESHA